MNLNDTPGWTSESAPALQKNYFSDIQKFFFLLRELTLNQGIHREIRLYTVGLSKKLDRCD